MGRIKICAAEEQVGKTVSSARDEFLRYCRLRNLSPRTVEFYREDIDYFIRWAKFKFTDDITKDVLDNFVIHEMDKGNKVTAINSRLRGLRVFFRYCSDKEYMEFFKYPLLKADEEHKEPYRGWEVSSDGNPHAHAILRGYVDTSGHSISNYHYEDLVNVGDLYAKSGLLNPSVIVDVNHNNSGKKYLEQIRIAKDVVYSRSQNADIKRLVKGLMIESYIEDGAQGAGEHIFGKSITDPCLGWEKTERLIQDLAEKL